MPAPRLLRALVIALLALLVLAALLALVVALPSAPAATALLRGPHPLLRGLLVLILVLLLLVVAWSLRKLPARLLRAARTRARSQPAPRPPPPERHTALLRAWKNALQRAVATDAGGRSGAGLPWFLLLGEQGAGKTTALASARLPTPLPAQQGSGSATGLTWWYADRLVVLDCGDTSAEDPGGAWAYSLRMLRRHRRSVDLAGVVVALSARSLLQVAQDETERDAQHARARALRSRLEQLITSSGKRLPVYLLITHCDALYGFEEWARAIGDQALDQALGVLVEVDEQTPAGTDFLSSAFDAIATRLRDMRWRLLARAGTVDVPLLMFPQELQALREPLQSFADNGLADHPYLERLLLRGLFFSSARQAGGARSRLLGEELPASSPHPPQHRGMFLHELFTRVLPGERGLRRPSARALRQRRRRVRALLALWLGGVLLAGIGITSSFLGNLHALAQLRNALAPAPRTATEADDEIDTDSRAAQWLRQMQALRRFDARARLPSARLTLAASDWGEVLRARRQQFVQACEAWLPAQLERIAADTQELVPLDARAHDVLRLLRLGSVLLARTRGADLEALETLPAPPIMRGAAGLEAGTQASDSHALAPPAAALDPSWQLQLATIAWTAPGDAALARRLQDLRLRLDALALQEPDLDWLLRVPALDGVAALRGEAAWAELAPVVPVAPTSAPSPSGAELAPSYTTAGLASMRGVMRQWLSLSLQPQLVRERWKAAREAWAARQRLLARAALERFVSEPSPPPVGRPGSAALPVLAGADNPYWRFHHQVVQELSRSAELELGMDSEPDFEPAAGIDSETNTEAHADSHSDGQATAALPAWLEAARSFDLWRLQSGAAPTHATWLESIRALGRRSLHLASHASDSATAHSVATSLHGERELERYLKALAAMSQRLQQGEAQAAGVAAEFHAYGVDPKVQQSLAHDAGQHLQALQRLLQEAVAMSAQDSTTPEAVDDFPIDAVVSAPWHALLGYADSAAACMLQRHWESDVLWPLQTDIGPDAMRQQVFGAQGTLWGFVDGVAAPFLRRDANSYRAAATLGHAVAFTPGFLAMLNRAARQQAGQRAAQLRQQRDREQRQAQLGELQARLQQEVEQLREARAQRQAQAAASATVSIRTLPTDVNPGAKARAFATRLELDCAGGNVSLDNLNLPQSRVLDWSPARCGATRLRIALGDLVLQRDYPGELGFADFLAEFATGNHVLRAQDFPAQARQLDALGVHAITVHFRFDSAEAALALAAGLREADQRIARLQASIDDEQARQRDVLAAAATAAAGASAPAGLADPGAEQAPPLRVDPATLGLPARIADCQLRP